MNIKIKRLIIIVMFVVFNFIIPSLLFKNGTESEWLFVVFKLLSIIAIPIFMFYAYDTSKMVKLLAILLLLVELSYLVSGLSVSYKINGIFLTIAVLVFYFSVFFMLFTIYVLKTEHFFSWKSIIPMIILTYLFWHRRLVELLCLYKNAGYDIGYYIRIGTYNELSSVITPRENIFIIYTIFAYIVFEVISYQNRKISID